MSTAFSFKSLTIHVLILLLPSVTVAEPFFHRFNEGPPPHLVDISSDGSVALLTYGELWKPEEDVVATFPPKYPRQEYIALAPDGGSAFYTLTDFHPIKGYTYITVNRGYLDGTDESLGFSDWSTSPLSFDRHGGWPVWSTQWWPPVYYVSGDTSGGSYASYDIGDGFEMHGIAADGRTFYGAMDDSLALWTETEGHQVLALFTFPEMTPRVASRDASHLAGTYRVEGESVYRFWFYSQATGIVALPGTRAIGNRPFISTHISPDGTLVQIDDLYWINLEPYTFAQTAAGAGHPLTVYEGDRLFISDDGRVLASTGWYLRLADAPPPAASPSITPLHLEFGQAQFARYDAITGRTLAELYADPDFPDAPDHTEAFPRFEFQGGGDSFGLRAWAWLVPEVTGDYTFWIASDDEGVLSLSYNAHPEEAGIVARVPGHTLERQYERYPEQQSATVHLEASKAYYLEAHMKQGWGGANLSVAWQGPGFSREVIPGRVLGLPLPNGGTVPPPLMMNHSANMAFYDGIPGGTLDALYANQKFPGSPDQILELSNRVGGATTLSTRLGSANFGLYMWTWFVPSSSGPHTFWLSSDDQGELWLSNSAKPGDAEPIASVPSHTKFEHFSWYPEQQSEPHDLTAGIPHFLAAVVKQGWSDAHVSVRVQDPEGYSGLIPTTQLTTFPGWSVLDTTMPAAEHFEAGQVAVARYHDVTGTTLSALRNAGNFPAAPDEILLRTEFRDTASASNYGTYAWAWLIPEVSGDYRFWLISDDQGELYLSPTADPANAELIANVDTYAHPNQFEKFVHQRSGWIRLEAGQPYYIAGLVQQGWGSSLLAVYWEGPGLSRAVIPGHVLALPSAPTP